ncbi:HupE/UreJ family protein [Amycolatopsis sp. SID8362]|uniref:HupE/UreJ family protein n=1 Tax=Amycolatopsis sp. SID8362 TaxID=2690346 RepID=UPI002815A9D6|nr:HupE/UreJ family protein [Amycolatopsis sp. SID8362]
MSWPGRPPGPPCSSPRSCSPPAASAHGISGSAADKNTLEFIPLGIEHMLLGWDHLLFIAGIVLLAGELRRAAKLISVFVLGHSTTLIAGTLAGWRVDATVVDIVIALSLVFVGVVGWFGLGVFAFGLVHGLGLSTRLQDLGLPEDGLFGRVIAFNVGVEIGQSRREVRDRSSGNCLLSSVPSQRLGWRSRKCSPGATT